MGIASSRRGLDYILSHHRWCSLISGPRASSRWTFSIYWTKRT